MPRARRRPPSLPAMATKGPAVGTAGSGITNYYTAKIEELEVIVRERTQNLRRLEAQRNELNSKVRLLREERARAPQLQQGEVVLRTCAVRVGKRRAHSDPGPADL